MSQQAFDLALRHHHAGRLQEAEQLYQQVLSQEPQHFRAMHNLGLIAYQRGKNDLAADWIRRAVALRPDYPQAYNNLGTALSDAGQLDQAIAAYQQAIAIDPNLSEAHNNLGRALIVKGQFDAAIAACRRALGIRPNYIEACINLGNALKGSGQVNDAIAAYRQAITLDPNCAGAYVNLGNALKDEGKIDEAIAAFRQAITQSPDYAEAHNNLAIALADNGQLDEAISVCRQTILLRPDYPQAWYNLGIFLKKKGQIDDAIAAYRQAITLKPDYAEAFSNLGVALEKKHLDAAIAAYRQAIAINPNLPEAHADLGNALISKGQLEEAIAACRQAIALKPEFAQAYNNLGVALESTRQFDEAIVVCRTAIALKPDFAEAHYNLGNALAGKGLLDEAIAAYRQALVVRPNYTEAYNNLGIVLKDNGQLEEAISAYHRAIELDPRLANAYSNLGVVLNDKGELDEAITAFRAAIAIEPENASFGSNLLFTMNFHPGYDAETIAEEHRRWNHQHAEPLRKFIQIHSNDRSPDRRLRIGYVSPDFRNHPVGRFLLPLLANHDKSQVDIFGYSDVAYPDEITRRLQSCTDHWRSIVGISDAAAVDMIRQDKIDILVDLTMHMAQNRLGVFARKPAPVQVTYLAYCSTTGLETIDYRLSDPYLDPPGEDESRYSEQTIRLPQTYWCYEPIIDSPEISPLPALAQGFITFGCLNNFCKISELALETWARILRAVPNSQLLLSARQGTHRQRISRRLERDGIEPHRVQFADYLPIEKYFDLYRRLDIALDTFPYAGGTTTCDALWMGVPVVSLAGKTAVGRGGLSILSNIGVPELVASSEEQYVGIAIELAKDTRRLTDLRLTLRQRMQRSPLMDAPKFTRSIEAAYRRMWHTWCATRIGGV